MSRTFYAESVTRQRAPLSDDGRGNTIPNWSGTLSTSTITGCRVQPLTSEELVENRYASDVTFRLLAPYGSDITYLDRIVAAEGTFEVWGEPESHKSPTSAAAHDEVMLRRVDG